jgi:hypothetical protein
MASVSVDRSGICNECAARIAPGNGQLHVDWHIDQYERMNGLLRILKTVTTNADTASAVGEVERQWAESPWSRIPE